MHAGGAVIPVVWGGPRRKQEGRVGQVVAAAAAAAGMP
jgi:hypothetical protein